MREDTELTLRIPANGGQNIAIELDLPPEILVDVGQLARMQQAQNPGPTNVPLPVISGIDDTRGQGFANTRMLSQTSMPSGTRALSMHSSSGLQNPPISSPQSLMVGSGSPELLSQSASAAQTVSAQTAVSPLRQEQGLSTGERFLPSISAGRGSRVAPRNQTISGDVLATREPSARAGLPFMLPSGSTTPTFQRNTGTPTPITIGSAVPASRAPSATMTSASRPVTGQELAEQFVSTSPSATPLSGSRNTQPLRVTSSASASSSLPAVPSRLTRSSPSKASVTSVQRKSQAATGYPPSGSTSTATLSAHQAIIQQAPSLSIARAPLSISQVLTGQAMSGQATQPTFQGQGQETAEEDLAEEESFLSPPVEEEGSSLLPSVIQRPRVLTGRDLFAREARSMIQKSGLEMDPDVEEESIEEAWNDLSPDQREGWDADAEEAGSSSQIIPASSTAARTAPTQQATLPACELPQAGSPSRRVPASTARTAQPSKAKPEIETEPDVEDEIPVPAEPLKPSCNMAVLLMKYANPNPQ